MGENGRKRNSLLAWFWMLILLISCVLAVIYLVNEKSISRLTTESVMLLNENTLKSLSDRMNGNGGKSRLIRENA